MHFLQLYCTLALCVIQCLYALLSNCVLYCIYCMCTHTVEYCMVDTVCTDSTGNMSTTCNIVPDSLVLTVHNVLHPLPEQYCACPCSVQHYNIRTVGILYILSCTRTVCMFDCTVLYGMCVVHAPHMDCVSWTVLFMLTVPFVCIAQCERKHRPIAQYCNVL